MGRLDELSPVGKKKILDRLMAEFPDYIDRYDEKKYPPAVLAKLREEFGRPHTVTAKTIETALKWKYGKHGRADIPRTLRPVIGNAAKRWKSYVDAGAPADSAGFAWWRAVLPTTSYISYAFLVHLRSPQTVPIIDQHNFRAVQHYLALGGCDFRALAKPSGWEHIVLVRDFIGLALGEWDQRGSRSRPSAGEIDRFLMMRGKALKND